MLPGNEHSRILTTSRNRATKLSSWAILGTTDPSVEPHFLTHAMHEWFEVQVNVQHAPRVS